MVKMVRDQPKQTTLCFSSIVCRTDVKDANDEINKINEHLQNYCKQQNIGFIDNKNVHTSDLSSKELHLKERGSSKLSKNILNCSF